MTAFLKGFKIGEYDIDIIRLYNSGRKVPYSRRCKWEYWFFVEKKGKTILKIDVPANNIQSAKRGLKGALKVRKLI